MESLTRAKSLRPLWRNGRRGRLKNPHAFWKQCDHSANFSLCLGWTQGTSQCGATAPGERDRSSDKCLKELATPRGLEPPTHGLGNRCSIRLSYGAASLLIAQALRRPPP